MTVTTDDNEASIHSSDSSREIGDLQHVAGGQVDSTIALQRNDGFDDDSAALANLSARRRKLARELAAQYLEEEAQYLEEEEKIPTSLINERLSTSVTPSATVNPASTLVPEVQTCDPVTVQMKAELKLQDDEDSKDIGTTDEEDGIDDEEKCMPSSTHEIEDGSSPFSNQAAPDSKYTTYHVAVNPHQQDRAVDIPLYSAARPHMRGFHMAWLSFFVSFFVWFAMTPLLSEIGHSLDLSRKEIWTSSVLAVSSSAVTRMFMGPLNDKYGARWVMATTLVVVAIPTGLAGLVNSAASLYVVRLLIGMAGSAFVTCQYWTSSMFTVEIAGTANALAAGWGNMAGGVAQILMGTLLFPLFKIIFQGEGYSRPEVSGDDEEKDTDDVDEKNERAADLAWRVILVFPALLSIGMAWIVIRYSDDTPKGNVNRRREGPTSATSSFRKGACSLNTWLLSFHYACSFGVEITMIQAAALYFKEEFGQSTEAAAAIASIFGWMNLFARGLGGFLSDMANAKIGLRGRLIVQVVTLVLEGILVIAFSFTDTLASAIMVMVVFSIFVQAAEGSTFGIVPYVDSTVTGTIAGIVGAGGNIGGVGFALLFRGLDDREAFRWMGLTVVGSAAWTALIRIPGHRTLFTGEDSRLIMENRVLANLPGMVSFPSPPAPAPGDAMNTSNHVGQDHL
jgi:NNP family nitrate/nitrite transporter-like MFS transporter